MTLALGGELGPYRILRLLGQGGMGGVYEAEHRTLHKRVALKVMHPDIARDPEHARRFLREGQAASRIRHPHAVDVYDAAIDGEVAYLVMEMLVGETLADRITRDPRPPVSWVVDVMLPVASALAAAHEEGVVHRDLKPENVFIARTRVSSEHPKLLDFGISKMIDSGPAQLTKTSALMGTPYYMSPEQARGANDVDGRTDVWSFGVILYEALTGVRPIEADSMLAVLHAITTAQIRPPREHRAEIQEGLERVILRALRREREERLSSVGALGRALLPYAGDRARLTWTEAFARGSHSAMASVGPNERALATPLPTVSARPPAAPTPVDPSTPDMEIPIEADAPLEAGTAHEAHDVSPDRVTTASESDLPPVERTGPLRTATHPDTALGPSAASSTRSYDARSAEGSSSTADPRSSQREDASAPPSTGARAARAEPARSEAGPRAASGRSLDADDPRAVTDARTRGDGAYTPATIEIDAEPAGLPRAGGGWVAVAAIALVVLLGLGAWAAMRGGDEGAAATTGAGSGLGSGVGSASGSGSGSGVGSGSGSGPGSGPGSGSGSGSGSASSGSGLGAGSGSGSETSSGSGLGSGTSAASGAAAGVEPAAGAASDEAAAPEGAAVSSGARAEATSEAAPRASGRDRRAARAETGTTEETRAAGARDEDTERVDVGANQAVILP